LNISVSSLVVLAASVFDILCRKTDTQTNRRLKPYPSTAFGVGNLTVLFKQIFNSVAYTSR